MRIPCSWLAAFLGVELSLEELEPILTMGIAEVEAVESVDGEEVLVLAPKPDRGDCLCVEGVAREIAALAGIPYRPSSLNAPLPSVVVQHPAGCTGEAALGASVRIDVPDLCPRYVACVVDNVRVGPSPEWLQSRIRQIGLRPVNNVVDVTNYVMFEMGQPLHAFDMDKLSGPAIIVRMARSGESIRAINGEIYELPKRCMVIADAEKAVAVAGVMGGMESEVADSTTRILIESAHFDPISVRMTSRALGLKSDASYRFERGVNPSECLRAALMAGATIQALAGGSVSEPACDVFPTAIEHRAIRLRPSRVNRLLGMDLSRETIRKSLERLDLAVVEEDDHFLVSIPTRRRDLAIEEDLVEEVARVVGYENVPSVLPIATTTPGRVILSRKVTEVVRDALVGTGYTDIRSYSLTNPEMLRRAGDLGPYVSVRNPISADRVVLRPALLPCLLEAAEANVVRGFRDQHLFEIGRVFSATETVKPEEKTRIGGLAFGSAWSSAWNRSEEVARSDFYSVKAVLDNLAASLRLSITPEALRDHPALHPGRAASIYLVGQGGSKADSIGFLGELHPDVAASFGLPFRPIVFELEMRPLVEAYEAAMRRPVDMEIYRQPPATRDIAVVVPEAITAAEMLESIRQESALVAEARVFDVYQGSGVESGWRSIAIALVLRASGRTLTDAEANAAVDGIVAHLGDQFGARRR